MIRLLFLFFCALGLFKNSNPSNGQTFVKTIDNWSAFGSSPGKDKVCYIASAPIKEKGNYTRRDDTYVLVSHRPTEKKRDVFELRAGYTYKKKSSVVLNIDGRKFKLFTSGGTAWAKTPKIDKTIARMMKRGRKMTVTGTSSRGTKTIDTYSLKGFTAAYNAIGVNCKNK